MTKFSDTLRKLLRLILAVVLIFSLCQIGLWLYRTYQSRREYSDLANLVLGTGNDTPENLEIDFAKLTSINSDAVGWISIPTLSISYPIVQTSDNDYYLAKDFYKQESISGSIFLDYRNHGFQDHNTIIYGHHMQDGTMFSKLSDILNANIDNDAEITIYTKNNNYHYQVFSAYSISPESYNMNETADVLKTKSQITFPVQVTKDDKYLTLYTCTPTATKRIIIHAILK